VEYGAGACAHAEPHRDRWNARGTEVDLRLLANGCSRTHRPRRSSTRRSTRSVSSPSYSRWLSVLVRAQVMLEATLLPRAEALQLSCAATGGLGRPQRRLAARRHRYRFALVLALSKIAEGCLAHRPRGSRRATDDAAAADPSSAWGRAAHAGGAVVGFGILLEAVAAGGGRGCKSVVSARVRRRGQRSNRACAR